MSSAVLVFLIGVAAAALLAVTVMLAKLIDA